jgi:hypothetical protein
MATSISLETFSISAVRAAFLSAGASEAAASPSVAGVASFASSFAGAGVGTSPPKLIED